LRFAALSLTASTAVLLAASPTAAPAQTQAQRPPGVVVAAAGDIAVCHAQGETYPFLQQLVPGSEARWADGFGVLKLVLEADRYEWEFVAVGGRRVDHGHGQCR